jgi:hypothetical protein
LQYSSTHLDRPSSARQLSQIAFLPLPANGHGLDREISGQETQQIFHPSILAGVRQTDTMPRMPFEQMRHVSRPQFGSVR